MAKRVLMVITPGMPGDLRSVALSAAAVARESSGVARLAAAAAEQRRRPSART